MKPLFLLCLPLPPPFSGEETLGLTLQQALTELNPKAYRLAYFDVSNKRSNQVRGRFNFGNIYSTCRLVLRFFLKVLNEKPDVVYLPLAQNVFGFLKYSLFIRIATMRRCKVITLLGGANFHIFFRNARSLLQRWIKKTLEGIDILIVQGENLRSQFDGLIAPEKLRVVHLGIDPAPFSKPGSSEKNVKEIRVLFVGNHSKAKGAFDLLNAIPLIMKQVPQIRFHFVGEVLEKEKNIVHLDNPKNNREAFYGLLERISKQDIVTLHGVLEGEKKIKQYQNADIFVLPSYSESFPFVLLEAAMAGLAIIATPVGTNTEVYKEGVNALFVRVGDFEDLAEKIITLARNIPLREKMAEVNKALVQKRFTHLHFGKRMDTLFLELINKAPVAFSDLQ